MLSITMFLPVVIALAVVIGGVVFGVVKMSSRNHKSE